MIEKICATYDRYENYRDTVSYRALDSTEDRSAIGVPSGERRDAFLAPSTYEPATDLQPAWRATAAQKARQQLVDTRFWLRTMNARRQWLPRV